TPRRRARRRARRTPDPAAGDCLELPGSLSWPRAPDSRVEHRVSDIGQQRTDRGCHADDEREAERHREVMIDRRLPDLPAHALDVEQYLHDQRTADDLREAEADKCHY